MKYKDKNKRVYKVGDIVFNTFFGDLWVVYEYNDNDPEKQECPYYLALYDDKDYYYTDLDTVSGFEILKSKDEEGYDDLLNEIKIILNKIKEEENGEQE